MNKPTAAELAAMIAAGQAEEIVVPVRAVLLKGGDSFLLTSTGKVYHDHVLVKHVGPGAYAVESQESPFAGLATKLKNIVKVVLVARTGPLGEFVGKLLGADGLKVVDAIASVKKGDHAVEAVGRYFGNEKLEAFGAVLSAARNPDSPGGAKITEEEYGAALVAFAQKL